MILASIPLGLEVTDFSYLLCSPVRGWWVHAHNYAAILCKKERFLSGIARITSPLSHRSCPSGRPVLKIRPSGTQFRILILNVSMWCGLLRSAKAGLRGPVFKIDCWFKFNQPCGDLQNGKVERWMVIFSGEEKNPNRYPFELTILHYISALIYA